MTIDSELLMAYADGELDPLSAKRVERAIAADPALAAEVDRHRALRDRIATGFAPVAEEAVPDRLAALLKSNVVAIPPRPAPRRWLPSWPLQAAMAACLVLGLGIGLLVDRGQVATRTDGIYARGSLASALDDQPGGVAGEVRVAVSFRDHQGAYCRVFSSRAADGIACRTSEGWALRRTMAGQVPDPRGGYAQAGSADGDLMAAAQDMMAGAPLDADAERAARAAGWR
jgi:hypothetical protein